MAICLDCPVSFTVKVDRLRLQQILINLGKNAVQHVQNGFVCLGARLLSDPEPVLLLYVEDSGPGIAPEQRANLFHRYQQSLERIHQGTGIGLFLSQQLAVLMGGSIWLDNTYYSGVSNGPGARFVLQLNGVSVLEETPLGRREPPLENQEMESISACGDSLPEKVSVLFCDDDKVLRKLFSRALSRSYPKWEICEADSGEAAVELCQARNEESPFDLIFMDQYMSSTEQRMLGTETVEKLRSGGCQAVICGLSANDERAAFLAVGANAFWLKPITTDPNKVKTELRRILSLGKQKI